MVLITSYYFHGADHCVKGLCLIIIIKKKVENKKKVANKTLILLQYFRVFRMSHVAVLRLKSGAWSMLVSLSWGREFLLPREKICSILVLLP